MRRSVVAEKLRIAYVLDDSLDGTDGVQQYVLTVSDWMRAQGHECHFLTGHTTRTDIENIHSTTKVLKVRFNKNRMATPLPANKKRLARLLNDQKFDVHKHRVHRTLFICGSTCRKAEHVEQRGFIELFLFVVRHTAEPNMSNSVNSLILIFLLILILYCNSFFCLRFAISNHDR